jgi:hypothetical protein
MKSKVKEDMNGLKERPMKEIGRTIKWMDLEF